MSDPIWLKVRNGSHRSYKAPKRKLRASPSPVFGAPKKQKPGFIRIDDLIKLGTNAPTQANHGQVSVNMATSQPLRDSTGRRSTGTVVHTHGSSAGPARQNNTSPTPMTPDDMTAWFIGFLQDPNMQRLLQNSLSVFDSAIRDNRAHIATLEDNFNSLYIDLEVQKQYSRRNAIRIHNREWVETNNDEDTDAMVLDVVNKVLGITTITQQDISRSHRVGDRAKGLRPVLVKFTTYRAKEKIMKSKKDLPTHISINEDLSPYFSKLAYEARCYKRSREIADTWTYDGRVYVKPTARDRATVVSSLDELQDILPPRGSTVTYSDAIQPRTFQRPPSNTNGPPASVRRSNSSGETIQSTAERSLPRPVSSSPHTSPAPGPSGDGHPHGQSAVQPSPSVATSPSTNRSTTNVRTEPSAANSANTIIPSAESNAVSAGELSHTQAPIGEGSQHPTSDPGMASSPNELIAMARRVLNSPLSQMFESTPDRSMEDEDAERMDSLDSCY